MKSERLALHGGSKAINYDFKPYNSIGHEELDAARTVVESGVLSRFIGAPGDDFLGGKYVRQFESDCETYFGVKHAITVNSWTSGLIAAVGAIGIEPGDEVIVSPWTMCASATAILHWNAIPVFADIDSISFNIDPKSIEKNITGKTRAILAVDIFGQSADMDAIMQIADRHGLKVISDTAQAPGARYKNKYAGTIAHVGGYSLNYHKHIHTGEGGVIVTDDDEIAHRLRLIRNHAEAVVEDGGVESLANMIGYNFRLGEIECAIGIQQLKKLEVFVKRRQDIAEKLTAGLSELPGLNTPQVMQDCSHVYYVYPMSLELEKLGASRQSIANALLAEGVASISTRYQNIHLLPMFQNKIAYGKNGFPWSASFSRQDVDYTKGICPNAEYLNDNSYLGFPMCVYDLSDQDVDNIIAAFTKVWAAIGSGELT